tara:strand:- start:176 stop:343 length:168 start_codon:yes stop_codon:yes gene_type:complete
MPFKVKNTKFNRIMGTFATEAEAQSWIDEKSAAGDPVTTDTPYINNTDCVVEEYN